MTARERPHWKSKSTILIALAIWIAALVFVCVRGQDQNWDLRKYHYYVGWALLTGRLNADIAAAGTQTFFQPLLNVVPFLAYAHLRFPFGSWLIASMQVLVVPAILALAREISCPSSRIQHTILFCAVVLCLLSPMWWSEIGTSFQSATTAPLIMIGLLLIVRAIPAEADTSVSSSAGLAGFLFGLAVGLKLTNSIFAIGAVTAASVAIVYRQDRISWFVRLVLGSIAGIALTAWWNIYLWKQWGSPIYPLYNAILRSPYYEFVNFHDSRWHFGSLWDFVRFTAIAVWPTTRTSEVPFADARFLLLLIAGSTAILIYPAIRRLPTRREIAILVFVATSLLVWVVMFAYQRYYIPGDLMLGLAICVLIRQIFRRELVVGLAMIGCTAFAAFTIRIADWGHVAPSAAQRNAFGLAVPDKLARTPADYLVFRYPVSYLFPFLDPRSRFFDINYSAHLRSMIRDRLASDAGRPIRVIVPEWAAGEIGARVAPFGLDFKPGRSSCVEFTSNTERYVACELETKSVEP